MRSACTATSSKTAGSTAARTTRRTTRAARIEGRPPRCAQCGNLVRPGVVWFGEMLPAGALEAAEQAARDCDVMVVVGTSGAVWPAAGLAGLARRAGAHVVIVNPQPSEIDDEAHVVLQGTAAQLLPTLFAPKNQALTVNPSRSQQRAVAIGLRVPRGQQLLAVEDRVRAGEEAQRLHLVAHLTRRPADSRTMRLRAS